MVGPPVREADVLNIQNIDVDAMRQPPSVAAIPTPSMAAIPTPSEIAPLEPLTVTELTPAEIDDLRVQQPPTARRVRFDECAVSLPQPSITVRPPVWACCSHGMHHDYLTIVYSWLLGHCNCDEASIMSFFALLQYNPAAHDECIDILEEIANTEDREEIRNYSAKLARLVENARKRVYPDGIEHAGKHSVDVEADMW